jgi:putative transcriptional regulator
VIRLFRAALLPVMLATLTALPAAAETPPEQQQREAVMLVAHPSMTDLRFAESVVVVTFPPDTGPMGVILNKPGPLQLNSVWPDRADRQARTDTLYYGGPVEPDGLLFVFRMSPAPERALWVTDDIHFSGDAAILDTLLAERMPVPDRQRFYVGYAGWAPGQLEYEIGLGGWYVLQVDPDVIFHMDSGDMWQRMLERATLPRAELKQENRTTETQRRRAIQSNRVNKSILHGA